MSSRRYSPSKRSGRGELLHFFLSLALLFIAAICFVVFIVQRDYTAPLAQPVAVEVTDDLLIALPTVKVVAADKATPAPAINQTSTTEQAAPSIETISQYNVAVDLTECNVIEQKNGDLLLLRGWGYIEALDAAKSALYIAVEPVERTDGKTIYFKATVLPGSTGIEHNAEGTNLDQADFVASVNAAEIPDGRYALGLMISNTEEGDIIKVTEPFDDAQTLTVSRGMIALN